MRQRSEVKTSNDIWVEGKFAQSSLMVALVVLALGLGFLIDLGGTLL